MKTHRKNTTIAPPRRRRPHHREEEAERFLSPAGIVENPDWLVGAD